MLSLKETKKIMEEDDKKYSDEELEKIRDGAYMLADIFIEGVLDKHQKKKTDLEDKD